MTLGRKPRAVPPPSLSALMKESHQMETPHLPTFKSHTLPTPSSLTFLLPRPSPPACWGSNLCRSFLSFLITNFPLCNHLPSCKQTNKQKLLTSLILYSLPLFYPHSWQKFCSLSPSFHICSSSHRVQPPSLLHGATGKVSRDLCAAAGGSPGQGAGLFPLLLASVSSPSPRLPSLLPSTKYCRS